MVFIWLCLAVMLYITVGYIIGILFGIPVSIGIIVGMFVGILAVGVVGAGLATHDIDQGDTYEN